MSEKKNGGGVNPAVVTGLTGIAIGAATVYLAQKENRKKVKDGLRYMRGRVKDEMETWKVKGEDLSDRAEEKALAFSSEISSGSERAKKKLDEAATETKKTLKEAND